MHKKILIAVDESDVTRPAVVEGLEMAQCFDAEVVFFHVLPNYVIPVMDYAPPPVVLSPEQHRKEVKEQAAAILSSAAMLAKKMGVRSHGAVGSGADAAECIADAAIAKKCDMIVIGSHGRTAFQRLILGSVVTRLITFSTVPVLVCKQRKPSNVAKLKVVPVAKKRPQARPRARAAGG